MSNGQNSPARWRLLTRPGCKLCGELAEALDEAFGAQGYVLEWVDVDSQDELRKKWGLVIPVLLDESSRPLSISRLDVGAVAAALGRPPRTGP